MRQIKYIAFLLLAFGLFFTSCNPENIDNEIDKEIVVKDKTENNLVTRSNTVSENGVLLGCITIDFPFSVVTVNDNTLEILDEDDFESTFFDSIDYVIDFVYPLNVTLEDGTQTIVNDIDELGELFGSCIPEDGWNNDAFPAFLIDDEYCVNLVYPFNVSDSQGNIYEVDSEETFIDLQSANEILFFEFPLVVIENETGEELIISNEEDFFEALLNCEQVNQPCDSIIWDGWIGCYEISFPVSLELQDGTIVEAENDEELSVILLQENVVSFAFPLDLIDPQTGIVSTVNSNEELDLLLISCYDLGDLILPLEILLETHGTCFDAVFPLTVITQDGNQYEVNTIEELEAYENQGASIITPFTIVLPDGTSLTVGIDTIIEFANILENC